MSPSDYFPNADRGTKSQQEARFELCRYNPLSDKPLNWIDDAYFYLPSVVVDGLDVDAADSPGYLGNEITIYARTTNGRLQGDEGGRYTYMDAPRTALDWVASYYVYDERDRIYYRITKALPGRDFETDQTDFWELTLSAMAENGA